MRIHVSAAVCIFLFCISPLSQAEERNVDIHGFISQGYLKSDDNNYMANTEEGTFEFNEMGINFSTKLSPKFRMGMQLFARDLGALGNDEITVDWAFADYRWQKWLGLRVGKFKSPKGLYYESRDFDMLRTFILLPQSVYTDSLRDDLIAFRGVSVYGKVGLAAAGEGYYQATVCQNPVTEDSGAIKLLEDEGGLEISRSDTDYTYQINLHWEPPVDGLKLGYTYLLATVSFYGKTQNKEPWIGYGLVGIPITYDITNNRYDIYSFEYTREDLILAAEYFRTSVDYEVLFDHPLHALMDQQDNVTNVGYYGSMCYRLTGLLEMGLYYSIFYRHEDDKRGREMEKSGIQRIKAWQKDGCLSLRFNITSNWCAKIEGHLIDGVALMQDHDNEDSQGQTNYTRNWSLFAAKVSYSF